LRLGWVKGDRIIDLLNWIGTPLVGLYIYSMIVYPWIQGGGDWGYVHKVWMSWQTLNVGVLAFISSMVAFNISKYHANQQRHREFIAARSFLPEALSDLSSYFHLSAELLVEAWGRAVDEADRCKTPLNHEVPVLPDNYREIFGRCISLGDPEVSQFLSYMLMRLQVHHSRMTDLAKSFQADSTMLIMSANIKSYLYRLAELQALVGRIFDFARGLEQFNGSPLTWEEFKNAYGNLDIWIDEFEDLEGFTKRSIERGNSDGTAA